MALAVGEPVYVLGDVRGRGHGRVHKRDSFPAAFVAGSPVRAHSAPAALLSHHGVASRRTMMPTLACRGSASGRVIAARLGHTNGGGQGGGGQGRGRHWRDWGDGEERGDENEGDRCRQEAHQAGVLILMNRRHMLTVLATAVALFWGIPQASATMATDLWMNQPFGAEDIPDVWASDPLRCAIVTGANSGIGLETAVELARKGWVVTLACRSRERGEAALRQIKERVPEARVDLMLLDLSSQQSVKDFDKEFRRSKRQLHLLINNAGIMLAPHAITKDLIEQTFASNYVGPFLLTNLLLPLLLSSSTPSFPSRVVNVGSEAHRWTPPGGIQFQLSTINDAASYQTLDDRWKW